MADMQVQNQVVDDGLNRSGVTSTTQTTADPVTGGQMQRSTTRMWSGRAPGVEIVWLIAGIVLALLAMDFILHATGAHNVGFAAFVFSTGSFFAGPFAGIFNTSTAAGGNLIIWADALAMVVYTLLAVAIVKVVGMASANRTKNDGP
jgi:hypothetical protein